MQVIVDSLLTAYDILGSGQPVLFLHGWGDNRHGLRPLALSLEGKQTVLLDLPGFGQTQAPPKAWGLDDYAAFVGDFLKKTEFKPVAIVAHSNGGAIAIRGLANGSLKTDKLVLLASAGIRDEYTARKKGLKLLAKGAKLLTAPLPKRAKHKLKRGAYNAIDSELFVAEHLQETFRKIVADDVMQDAARVNVPVLLVYGSDDESTPLRYGEKFAAVMPKAELKVVPGAGHFVHVDEADAVSTYLKDFLK